ncbi:hypothetical protein GCM10022223_61040 [Kineosporia mesophila]|uniref:ATP-grasp domain-containing protein n=1 Tax=Kineosporia mesophila TaxID=566012 RepID=A0ABP7AL60_9ACTN|nr:hypothetical protein [Kineosporia mesophila]MCD5355034.1 hypothetical protein [Kineosporia mesophila]
MSRPVAIVLGARKSGAVRAMSRFAGDYEFVDLPGDVTVTSIGPDLVDAVDAVAGRRPLAAVLASSESTMPAAAFLRGRYALPGLGPEQAALGTNKWLMRSALRGRVAAPQAWLSGAFLDLAASPVPEVVIKPLASSSARGVSRMPTPAARAFLRANRGLWLVEEALAVEREFHCDGVVHDGHVEWLLCSEYDRPVLRSFGTRTTTVLPTSSPFRAGLAHLAGEVLGGLGIGSAVFHLETLWAGETLYFGEIGLRPAGTGIAELLLRSSGADLWAAHVAAQLGHDPRGQGPVRAVPELSGLVMARPTQDGQPPLPRHEARRLPGVDGTADGNLPTGHQPSNMCEFEYLAFFENLSPGSVERLRGRIGREAAQ